MEGQQVRKTRPENVHFAKKAKRVDVKRLKDDIWSGLKTLVPDPETEGSSEEVSPSPSPWDKRGCLMLI
jgi:condensin complex subunit 2